MTLLLTQSVCMTSAYCFCHRWRDLYIYVTFLSVVDGMLILTKLSRHDDTSHLEQARVSYELNVFAILPNLQTLLAVVCFYESDSSVEE